MKEGKTKNKSIDKRQIATKIIAGILVGLMLVAVFASIIFALL